MLSVDLHTHSNYSDGVANLTAIQDHCRKLELGIALTDHNEIRGSIELISNEVLPCIPGVEVGTLEGLEFLVYFAEPELLEEFFLAAVEPHLLARYMVRSNVKAVDCLDRAKELGAFVSLAHPFAFGRKSLNYHKQSDGQYKAFIHDVISRIDAVEHYNAGVPRKVNEQALELHLELEKKITVGSDAHKLKRFGAAGVTMDGDMTSRHRELFDALHANDFADLNIPDKSRVLATLPIIMYKHTRFFLTKGNGARNRPDR
jgi:hypothetical protein